MSGHLIYWVAAWVFGTGLYGIATSRNLIHLCLCLAVLQSSTYLVLSGIGYRAGGAAPVFLEGAAPSPVIVDPIVQALMLTDIVVEATVVALLLSLAVKIHRKRGTLDPAKLGELRG